jgi:hypothetical protein
VRVIARVAQDQLVKLAGLETQFIGHEDVLARLAEVDRNFDRLLARQVTGGMGYRRCEQQRGGDLRYRPDRTHELHPPWNFR